MLPKHFWTLTLILHHLYNSRVVEWSLVVNVWNSFDITDSGWRWHFKVDKVVAKPINMRYLVDIFVKK